MYKKIGKRTVDQKPWTKNRFEMKKNIERQLYWTRNVDQKKKDDKGKKNTKTIAMQKQTLCQLLRK